MYQIKEKDEEEDKIKLVTAAAAVEYTHILY
jgi:hypothetical protein